MKSVVNIFMALVLTSCSIIHASLAITVLVGLIPRDIRPGYVVSDIGLLSSQELENFPEVLVVHTFEDFPKAPTQNRAAPGIDKDALQLIDSNEPIVQGLQRVTYSLFMAMPG